jgi:putative ABC transport system substrate-binding protein
MILAPIAALAGAPRKVRVLMILWRGETDAEKGFIEKLLKTPGIELDYTEANADNDENILADILDNSDLSEYDFIYTFGTTVTANALAKIKDKPIIFNVVARPVEAGIVKSMKSSGNNVTGVSSQTPMEMAVRALEMVIFFRKVGFVYNHKEKNSVIQREEIASWQGKFGFILKDADISSPEEASKAVKAILDAKVDAVMLPSDSMVVASASKLVALFNHHKIRTITTVPELVKNSGALLAIGPDYRELGGLAADTLLKILNGANPSSVPVKTAARLTLTINMKTARLLGVSLPIQLLSMSTLVY